MFVKTHPYSVFPYKHIFQKELAEFPESSERKLSEINIVKKLKETDSILKITLAEQPNENFKDNLKKQIFSMFYHSASAEEYKFFRKIMKQDMDDAIKDKIWSLVLTRKFPREYLRYFFKAEDFSLFTQSSPSFFENERNEDTVLVFKEDLKLWGMFGKIIFEYDMATKEKSNIIIDKRHPLVPVMLPLNKFYNEAEDSAPGETVFFLASGDKVFCSVLDTRKRCYFMHPKGELIKPVVEHVFYLSLVKTDAKGVMFFDLKDKKNCVYELRSIIDKDEFKYQTLTIDGFTVMPFMLFGNKYGMLAGVQDPYYKIVGKIEDLEAIPPERKKFRVLTFRNQINILKSC
jgi:hypothetical protein